MPRRTVIPREERYCFKSEWLHVATSGASSVALAKVLPAEEVAAAAEADTTLAFAAALDREGWLCMLARSFLKNREYNASSFQQRSLQQHCICCHSYQSPHHSIECHQRWTQPEPDHECCRPRILYLRVQQNRLQGQPRHYHPHSKSQHHQDRALLFGVGVPTTCFFSLGGGLQLA
jgi:hypothetical protein